MAAENHEQWQGIPGQYAESSKRPDLSSSQYSSDRDSAHRPQSLVEKLTLKAMLVNEPQERLRLLRQALDLETQYRLRYKANIRFERGTKATSPKLTMINDVAPRATGPLGENVIDRKWPGSMVKSDELSRSQSPGNSSAHNTTNSEAVIDLTHDPSEDLSIRITSTQAQVEHETLRPADEMSYSAVAAVRLTNDSSIGLGLHKQRPQPGDAEDSKYNGATATSSESTPSLDEPRTPTEQYTSAVSRERKNQLVVDQQSDDLTSSTTSSSTASPNTAVSPRYAKKPRKIEVRSLPKKPRKIEVRSNSNRSSMSHQPP